MDPYKNIIIICLLGVILLGCSILSKKTDNEIELPTDLKYIDIKEIIAGKEILIDTADGGNAVNEIVVDLSKEDAEKPVELFDNMKEMEIAKVEDTHNSL